VRYLCEKKGANANKPDDGGVTPVSAASLEGHLPVLRYLVGAWGCDVDTPDDNGSTPVAAAAPEQEQEQAQVQGQSWQEQECHRLLASALEPTVRAQQH
jgi:ankyrin repeat protein